MQQVSLVRAKQILEHALTLEHEQVVYRYVTLALAQEDLAEILLPTIVPPKHLPSYQTSTT